MNLVQQCSCKELTKISLGMLSAMHPASAVLHGSTYLAAKTPAEEAGQRHCFKGRCTFRCFGRQSYLQQQKHDDSLSQAGFCHDAEMCNC